ncbi:unnamed protein product, partial [Staurois parvus]
RITAIFDLCDVQGWTDHLETWALPEGPGSVGGPMRCPWYLFHRLFGVWARTQGPHDLLLPGGPHELSVCPCPPLTIGHACANLFSYYSLPLLT